MPPRLYVDNAATSNPKPPEVLQAMCDFAENVGVLAGRGGYREAGLAGHTLADCRRKVARLVGAGAPERIVFCLNCTEALNLAVKGILRAGDHVVTTVMEHNSVLRPLAALVAERRIEVTHVPADPATGTISPETLFEAFRPNTRLISLTHGSNVTGALQPIDRIARDARRGDALLLVDAAQTAGHVPIDVEATRIDLLALSGHKGLMGPVGVGMLYIRKGLERQLRPLVVGGTGSVSADPSQPEIMPDKYESGTHNLIGIAGLGAALTWIEDRTVDSLLLHDRALCRRFLEGAAAIDGLTVYGPRDPEDRIAVFSVRLSGMEPEDLSAVLEAEFGLLTRSGLHCAPLCHKTIGTFERGGTTRFGFGALNREKEVDYCLEALAQVAAESHSV